MDGERVTAVHIALGGVATRPWRASAAERMLIGQPLTTASSLAAGHAALAGAKVGRQNGFKVELGARTVADALMIAKGRTA